MILNRMHSRAPWLLGDDEYECALCGLRTSDPRRVKQIIWLTVSGYAGDTHGNAGRYLLTTLCDDCASGLTTALTAEQRRRTQNLLDSVQRLLSGMVRERDGTFSVPAGRVQVLQTALRDLEAAGLNHRDEAAARDATPPADTPDPADDSTPAK